MAFINLLAKYACQRSSLDSQVEEKTTNGTDSILIHCNLIYLSKIGEYIDEVKSIIYIIINKLLHLNIYYIFNNILYYIL